MEGKQQTGGNGRLAMLVKWEEELESLAPIHFLPGRDTVVYSLRLIGQYYVIQLHRIMGHRSIGPFPSDLA